MNLLVVDVETYGTDPKNGKLLGVAIAGLDGKANYWALQWYDFKTSTWHKRSDHDWVLQFLRDASARFKFIGHNYCFDKLWLDTILGVETFWHADTRLMWHMASAPSGPRPYGLKDAQVELLGYPKRGDVELEEQVKARKGNLKKGDHYLADVEVLSKYACMDAKSTAELYLKLKPFFDKHDYWWMLEKMMTYSWLLQECTTAGIAVDVEGLTQEIEDLSSTKSVSETKFKELAKTHIERLERMWRDHRATKYTLPLAKEKFLASHEMQKKFKLSSDKDKRELFYDSMGLPIVSQTDGGKGATGVDSIKLAIHSSGRSKLQELVEGYEQYEKSETILNSFARPWMGSVSSGRLHPRFNPCGTVSYRLSGFKPYLLNAPFNERALMSCLRCDEGWEGLHADFASIEPCVTAHYSQDPNLLKVFREGQGDVYLDLALTLFPLDTELASGYDPNSQATSTVKERFKRQRNIAKIIQLAVQYTGTKYTVSRNLTEAGFPTSLAQADELVTAYWKHFRRVAIMNEAFHRRYTSQGFIRNVVGRIIRVPDHVKITKKDGTIWEKPVERYKDLPNRIIQSSAHDLLSLWVLNIASKVRDNRLRAKAVILDCHDSTSWQAPKEEISKLEEIFKETLTELNETVKMTVLVRIEMKRFTTLAGLKGEE